MLLRKSAKNVWKSCWSVFIVFPFLIQTLAAQSNYIGVLGISCSEDNPCRNSQICNNGICECDEFSIPQEYAPGKEFCKRCPMEGQPCLENCCFGEDIFCVQNICTRCKQKENGGLLCPHGGHIIFATASQIALSAALIIGIAALATLLFRMCSKRSLSDRPRNQGLLSDERGRLSAERASLSSIQIRILQRLRDRPPRYETRHNFNFRSQSVEAGIAPPSYDSAAATSTDSDLPPPYTIAVGSPAFENAGFTSETEPDSRPREAEEPESRTQSENCSETSKSPKYLDDDKAIHM
ncbi:uncharacterized protein LOC129798281 [Phlebotomus papatasi]|uniref:uncharacterized protein LOC129798281 n=1 Tax=Phlebotomus papatasi TaxID=29031 RepID=UPI002484393F|nr:uncharacterized protein LOC129798281 [Phlebotomus papatasi]